MATIARQTGETKIVRGACPQDCPDTCAFLYHVEDGRLMAVTGDPDHPMTRGGLCVKLKDYAEHHYNPERLLHPLMRVGPKGSGQFRQITYDEALAEIKRRWTEIIDRYGPQAITNHCYLGNQGTLNGLTSGDAFFNRLGATIGEKCYCESGSSTAWIMTVGPTGGLDVESLAYAKYIIVWGMNMISTNLHGWPFILEAKEKGAKVVVIDPVRTRTAKAADWHIAIRPGTDGALALGMMNVIMTEDLVDHDYVAKYTVGYDELKERAKGFPPERVAEITGISGGRHPQAGARVRHDPAFGHSPGRGDRAVAGRRRRDSAGHLAARARRRVAPRRRRHRRDADLGLPVQLRLHPAAGLDPAGHPGRERARPRPGAHRRAGPRSAAHVRVHPQLQPGVPAAEREQDAAGADARGPVHGRERALHDRHGALRRHHPAVSPAGRAVRPPGDLGASLRHAQPAGHSAAGRVRPERRHVPPARADDGLRRRLLVHVGRRAAPAGCTTGAPRRCRASPSRS